MSTLIGRARRATVDQHGVHRCSARVRAARAHGWEVAPAVSIPVVSVRIVAAMSATHHLPANATPVSPTSPGSRASEQTWQGDGWCRVRVHGPAGAVDVALPTSRTVADLCAELAGRLLPGAPLVAQAPFQLHRVGQTALDQGRPLAAADPREGEVFHLSPSPTPSPARVVDDALHTLGTSAGAAGVWAPATLAAAATTGAMVASVTLALAVATIVPGVPALPLLGAAALLAAALVIPHEATGSDVARATAAAAALPLWAGAGLALARATATSGPGTLALAGLALAVGAGAALGAVPTRAALWATPIAAGALVGAGGLLVAGGVTTSAGAAGVMGTVVLVAAAGAPWLIARSARWSSPHPGPVGREELTAAAARTRALITALSLAGAGALAACSLVLATSGAGLSGGQVTMARWLALALALVAGLRARRTRFALESASMVTAAVLPLVALVLVVVALAAPGARWALVAALTAALAGVLALVVVLRSAQDGDRGALSRLTRPRVRRALSIVEGVVAVSVIPLLAGVLGVYAAAANAGTSL